MNEFESKLHPFQAVGGGILRGCGRQSIGAIVIFIGYYIISLPIGVPLLLLSSWRVKGFIVVWTLLCLFIFFIYTGLWIAYAVGVLIEALAFLFLVFTTNWDLESEYAVVRAGALESKAEILNKKKESVLQEKKKDNAVTDKTPLLEPVRRKITPSELERRTTGMRRSYSGSPIIDTIHGRRFSTPAQPSAKILLPDKKRRYSTRHIPQIQEHILEKLTEKNTNSLTFLLGKRVLALVVCLGVFLIGLLVRLNQNIITEVDMTIVYPNDCENTTGLLL